MSAPADRTVPGTHPVEYTLKSAATLYNEVYSLLFIFWYIFYFALKWWKILVGLLPGCFILAK